MSFKFSNNFIFTLTSLAKISTIASTLGQAFFVLILLFNLRLRRYIYADIFVFYVFLLVIFLINSLINGFTLYSIKNIIYILLAPYVFAYRQFFSTRYNYLTLLVIGTILWYLADPSSYLTRELGSFPRFVGPFINPNVAGVSMLLIITYVNNYVRARSTKCILFAILIFGIYLTQSKTAWILLPVSFLQKKYIFWYFLTLISFSWYALARFNLQSVLPSLYARFSLWSQITSEDIKLFGNGFDTFGAGLGTVSSSSVEIIDSFYLSALVSGGVIYLGLMILFFFIVPFTKSTAEDKLVAPSVAIMAASCVTGNFLENGFPANIIFIALIMLNRHARTRS